jgi:hypothetical protein
LTLSASPLSHLHFSNKFVFRRIYCSFVHSMREVPILLPSFRPKCLNKTMRRVLTMKFLENVSTTLPTWKRPLRKFRTQFYRDAIFWPFHFLCTLTL